MLENQLKILLDNYFKRSLLNAMLIISLVFSVGSCLLLTCIAIILQDPRYAWALVVGIILFWLIALLVMWICTLSETKKIELTSSTTQPQWLNIALELAIHYFFNKKRKNKL
jgi:uncharacterized membrane protein YqjE